ncbi:MAG: peptidase C14, partial [Cyanobacteria bacterium P01_F01_bin.143]
SHQDSVFDIAFSADNKYFATGSDDGTAKLIEISSGKETIISHQDSVSDIAFSADNKYFAITSKNKVNLIFLDVKELIDHTCSRLSQNLSLVSWHRYFGNIPYQKTCKNLPIHPSLLREGEKLARSGKIQGAISIYKRAKKLEPGIDLNPDTQAIEQNPRQVANQFFTQAQLKQGDIVEKKEE